MKNLLILFLFSLLHLQNLSAQDWNKLSDFPGTERDDGVSFTIGNKAYCLTGLQVGWSCTKDAYCFDGNNESWSSISALLSGNERQYATAFSYREFGYVMGGIKCGADYYNDLWRYDTTSNSWSQLLSMPDSGRMGSSSFVLNNKAYIIGGRTKTSRTLNDVWEYDFVSNSWTKKNSLPINGFWRGAAFAIDSAAYICYGEIQSGIYNNYMYRYNAINDTWNKLGSLKLTGRTYISTATLDHKQCLYGGLDSLNKIKNELLVFDPLNLKLSTLFGIPTLARKGSMAFSLNNKFYLTTGIDTNDSRLKETWRNNFPLSIRKTNRDEIIFYSAETHLLKIMIQDYYGLAIQLADISGIILLNKNISDINTNIDLMHVKSGIYFALLKENEEIISCRKIVVFEK